MLRPRGDVAVPVVRLDDVEVSGPVSLVEVDVEGMEMAVLAGAEALVAEHRPALAVEVATPHLAPRPPTNSASRAPEPAWGGS